jgi:predicted nuclease of predicted toxin-antitoxin system
MQVYFNAVLKKILGLLLLTTINIASGQIIKSKDNIRISTRDSLLNKFELFLNKAGELSDDEHKFLISVANCFLDVVPNRMSYKDNLIVLASDLSFQDKIMVFQKNQSVVKSFSDALKNKNIETQKLMNLYSKMFAYFYCTEIAKSLITDEKVVILCQCTQKKAPDIVIFTQSQEVYFKQLEDKMKECLYLVK